MEANRSRTVPQKFLFLPNPNVTTTLSAIFFGMVALGIMIIGFIFNAVLH